MQNILFFGDSITAGYGLANPTTESFPALIQQKIQLEHLPYKVTNGGLSGDTSSGGLSRLDHWLRQPADVFVLELGLNDIIRGLPNSSTHHNLEKILQKVSLKYPSCQLVILGVEVPLFSSAEKIEEFRKIFRALATAHGAVFVPSLLEGVVGVKHHILKDGLHPSDKGHQVIAETVWAVLKPLLAPQLHKL
ncbi:arylesterase [Chryseolinea lacunae]|uniref:Arylesterase n=1 Tax=Chryseolinea lacunae TaxID=2801331 RepID=A0ABS1KM57_9BACT|nr:arylesterase [Chryseolinea lacunae]MBL0740544.1 arylesterase [Chryseolinea lacunae]